jgi:hypothetical protein
LTIARLVVHAHSFGLDRNALLTLKIHAVEQLVAALARADRAGCLKQSIRQGRLAVVDVGDDTEVSYQILICHIYSEFAVCASTHSYGASRV